MVAKFIKMQSGLEGGTVKLVGVAPLQAVPLSLHQGAQVSLINMVQNVTS